MQSKSKLPSLDPAAVAKGIGTAVEGPGYVRVVVDGKTIAYVKPATITVPAWLIVKAPKRLGAFKVEANGRWAGIAVTDSAKARKILEYVAGQKETT
jgi:hypothetical protein